MGMRLWWRIQRGDGGISFSRGFDLCLVLECETSLTVCVVEFDFSFLFYMGRSLEHFIVEDKVSFAMISVAYLFLVSEIVPCLLPWMVMSSIFFTCYSYEYPW